MHTSGKVLLILGGLITATGLFFVILGGSMTSFDLQEESVASGKSGTFSAGDSGVGFSVWVSENTDCYDVDISVTYNDVEKFSPDCIRNDPQQDDGVEGYYKIGQVGLLDDDGGMCVHILTSSLFCRLHGGIWRGSRWPCIFHERNYDFVLRRILLVLGLILGLTIKSAVQVMAFNGQMMGGQMIGGQMMAGQMPMQQMPAQHMQMPAQTTAQPYEYEQK